jgi:tetratricopeptide (TPR) repeat protein
MAIKKILHIIFITIYITAGTFNYCIANNIDHNEYIREYMDIIMQQLGNDNIPGAIGLLDDALEQYPNSISLLKLRYELLAGKLKFNDALSDIEKILKLDSGDMRALLDRCIIQEYIGGNKDQILQCYVGAVKKMRISHTQNILKDDIYYVLAVILAELPESEEVKKNFLKSCDGLISVTQREHINNFDRNKLMKFYQLLKENQ